MHRRLILRMQYHARSLLANKFNVDVICYSKGSTPLPELLDTVSYHYIDQPKKITEHRRPIYLLLAINRVITQILSILYVLSRIPIPSHIIIQNPPAIPTLFIVQIYRLLTRSKLIIDWHNFGYSILALNLGRSVIVRVAEVYEWVFGRCAHAHFTVTRGIYTKQHNQLLAMKEYLEAKWKVKGNEDLDILLDALVLYDNEWTLDMASILMIITGKGPRKEFYESKIKKLTMKHVTIHMMWLKIEDYPRLLGMIIIMPY